MGLESSVERNDFANANSVILAVELRRFVIIDPAVDCSGVEGGLIGAKHAFLVCGA